jgi:recA bacterial DNA recombination protein
VSTPAQALALAELLEGRSLGKKASALELLTGLGAKLSRASDLPSLAAPRDPIPTMVPALDRLLCGGLPRGGFVELSGRRSCGRFSIGIAALASATSCGEAAALVDLGSHLDPQAAEAAGVELELLLWVRPEKLKDAVTSAEMLLSAGFPLVVLDLGLAPVRGRFVPDAAWVRLERAARSRHAALLLLAPYRVSGIAADTVLAADTARASWRGMGRAPRLLCGVSSRLTLQKDARARTGVGEDVGWRIYADAPLEPGAVGAGLAPPGRPARQRTDLAVSPRAAQGPPLRHQMRMH